MYNVNDPDVGDTLTYSLVAGDYLTKLGIDPTTGQLHLTADLSVPNTLTSNITVQITDSNGLKSTAVVEMIITNVNNVPYFLNLPFTVNVDETISPGSVLYSVTAHDNDAVDVLSYSVAYSPTSASSLLQFDSTGTYHFVIQTPTYLICISNSISRREAELNTYTHIDAYYIYNMYIHV